MTEQELDILIEKAWMSAVEYLKSNIGENNFNIEYFKCAKSDFYEFACRATRFTDIDK